MRILFPVWLVLSAGVATAPADHPDSPQGSDATRYTVLIMGNQAGVQRSARHRDGSWEFSFEFNDRGRGPKITEHVVLDAGIPTAIESSGQDYFKAPVEERFSLRGGTAKWKNRAESGEKHVTSAAFYVSLSGIPEETALLARALLVAPGGRLPLLPAGEARIERRGELKIRANGRERTVVQYAISGIDFSPTPVWLDGDGTFFALIVGSWSTVIREGWESSAPSLSRAQDEFDHARMAALARAAARQSTAPLVLVHARLFDAERAVMLADRTIVIEGRRIVAVGPDGQVSIPPGAEIIDAAGKSVLPGLWDMHTHLGGSNDGVLHMAAGVTTVRDLANDIEHLAELKGKYDSGAEVGPRILMAGFLDGRGPYAGPTKVFADSEQEAREAIEKYARLGYVQIKLYSSIKPELVPTIIEAAHGRGLRASGHVPAFMTAEQFVRDGADEIQHMNFIFLNFLFDRVRDTRTPARFTEVAQHGVEIDPSSDTVRSFIRLLKERHTVVDPTLSIFEGLFTDRPGQLSASYAAVADRLPVQIRRGFTYGGLEVPEGMDARYRGAFRQMLAMTAALHDAGVTIVAGTDALAGFALHRELELYVEAGIPAPEVLQLATLGAARVMKRDVELGSITPGKLADLLLVDGDPASRISDVRRVRTVVKDGTMYQASALYEALGVGP